jgi:nitric oxide reductase large subunit
MIGIINFWSYDFFHGYLEGFIEIFFSAILHNVCLRMRSWQQAQGWGGRRWICRTLNMYV